MSMNISEPLLDWFDRNKRTHLPWRMSSNPYHVWISEIMLQQTRVETVIPYFNRFIDRLPSLQDLALISEDELLKLWEGLGYYSRARNLQKAAKVLVEEQGGLLPSSYEELKRLPGIGPYTAGAIASIAYQQKVIAADGNAYRIAARLLAHEGFVEDAASKKDLEQFLNQEISKDRPGDFNQALMDLGSAVCLAKGEPLCNLCPLSKVCAAFAQGIQQVLPKRKPKKTRRIEEKTVLVYQNQDGAYFLVKRPPQGLLAAMWAFPMLDGFMEVTEIKERLLVADLANIEDLGFAKHIFSHVEWHMKGYLIATEADAVSPLLAKEEIALYGDNPKTSWVSSQDMIDSYSIPTAYRHFLAEITKER